jgi:hypothetical protein
MPKKPDPVEPGFAPIEVESFVDETFIPIEVVPYEAALPVTPAETPVPTIAPSAGAAEIKEK